MMHYFMTGNILIGCYNEKPSSPCKAYNPSHNERQALVDAIIKSDTWRGSENCRQSKIAQEPKYNYI